MSHPAHLAVLGLILGVLGACSASGTPAPGSTTSSSPVATPVGSSAASALADEGLIISVTHSVSLGDYLTGQKGLTLYIRTSDSPSTSTCVDACAVTWPPLTIVAGDSITAGEGLVGTLSTFSRGDGSIQMRYNGAPLYYYSGDVAAGDAKGQGQDGVWLVAPANPFASPPVGSTPGVSVTPVPSGY